MIQATGERKQQKNEKSLHFLKCFVAQTGHSRWTQSLRLTETSSTSFISRFLLTSNFMADKNAQLE
jgi:hypothetical protein